MDPVRLGPLKPGDVFLGKYEVQRLLGSGGHAFVYECFDPFLSRVVAIKVIKPITHGGDGLGNINERARTEAQLLSRIDHDKLVKVIDAGVWEGLVYLVMEYLDGRNLRDILRELGRLSVAEALTIGIQIADGMAHAHGKRVIHRDLKPENIFVIAENVTKVLDFGIAKVRGLDGLDAKTTQPDMVQGTWIYMSPEHLQGNPVTQRSDIFALGTLLFESLYAHPLRVGEAPVGRDEAAWMQIAKVPPLLCDLDPSIPRYVAKVIHRALLKVPDERYATMLEVREAFMGALKRHLTEDDPKGLVVLRQLYRPQPAKEEKVKAAERNTLRAAPVLTSQVTVKAPAVFSGDTQPLSKLPASLRQPQSNPGSAMTLDVPANPAPIATRQSSAAPPSSEKPTIWVNSGAVPVVAASAPRPARASSPPSARPQAAVAPNTATPVAARAASPELPLPNFLQDRAIRLAAVAAVVLGVGGGTAYGLFGRGTAAPIATPTLAPSSATAAAHTALVVDSPASPAPAPAPAPSVAPPSPTVAASATPVAAAPPPRTVPSPGAAPARVAVATKLPSTPFVDSGLPSADDVERRFQEFDRRTKAKAAAAPKPAPTPQPAAPPKPAPRPRETVF